VEAREKMKLRHAPLCWCVRCASGQHRQLVAETLFRVISVLTSSLVRGAYWSEGQAAAFPRR